MCVDARHIISLCFIIYNFYLLRRTNNSVNKLRKKKIFPLDQTLWNHTLIHSFKIYFFKIRFNIIFLPSFRSFNLSFSEKFSCKNFWSFKLSFSKKNFPCKNKECIFGLPYTVFILWNRRHHAAIGAQRTPVSWTVGVAREAGSRRMPDERWVHGRKKRRRKRVWEKQ